MTLSFLWFGAFASAGGTAMAALTHFPGGLSVRGADALLGLRHDRRLRDSRLRFSGVVYRADRTLHEGAWRW